MASSTAVRCESIWEKKAQLRRDGLQRKSFKVILKAWCTEHDLPTFEHSGANRERQNSTGEKPQVSVNRNHKPSIKISPQSELINSRLVSTSKGTANVVIENIDHIKVCAVLSHCCAQHIQTNCSVTLDSMNHKK